MITVFPKEPVVDVLAVGVEIVEDYIGVARVTGSEYDDFVVFAEVAEYFWSMGTDVDACFDDLAGWEGNGQLHVIGGCEGIVAVD